MAGSRIGRRLGELRPAQAELVKAMHRIRFGRVEGLQVRDGVPVIDAAVVIQEIKLPVSEGAEGRCLPSMELKQQVKDLLDLMERLGHGRLDSVVVKHGLPFSVSVPLGSAALTGMRE